MNSKNTFISLLKQNIYNNYIFFIGYLLFLFFCTIIISIYSKTETCILFNGFWTSSQDLFFKYITHLGDGIFAFLIIILLFIYKVRYGIYALCCFSITAIFTQILKRIIFSDVLRPSQELFKEFNYGDLHIVEGVKLLSEHSFPSGHSTSIFSISCLIILLSKNKWIGLFMIIIAILSSYSRVYLSQHFIEDIFVGSIIGCIGTLLIYSFLKSRLNES